MKKIVYYVASSLDGFISGPNDDISMFQTAGLGVEKYLSDLQNFGTVIMGRKTYEFGYQYGLQPGQPAYPHMKHFIFSQTLQFDVFNEQVKCLDLELKNIEKVRDQSSTDIYLCGGGQFAGWLLENNMIDVIKIKLNPIILGDGVRIFGSSNASAKMNLVAHESFDHNFELLTYNLTHR